MARSGSSIATWSVHAGVRAYAVPIACGQGPDRPCWGRFAVTCPGDASPWDVDEPTFPHVDQPWEVRAERHPMVKQQRTAGSGDDVEAGHHPVVLVVEHVAVDHEGAGVVGEAGGHLDDLARLEAPGVLEALLPGRGCRAVAQHGAPLLG